ncbi:MAG: rhomboid family intramembrane serine protease [bacterium]|nr:rhomboid family intramembrane serine protease [bacterium]
MDKVNVRKQDQILMSLVHYFVTKEGYAPIFVQGVKDEIWLEKVDGPYRIIRINNNYIHNEEQYNFEQFKIKNIMKQIKRKTLSFTINTLNIDLNVADRVEVKNEKNVDNISIHELSEVQKNNDIVSVFPNIKTDLFEGNDSLDLIINVTKDINNKTESDNKKFEKIFSKKKLFVTYILMGLCFLMYIVTLIMGSSNVIYLILGANYAPLVKNGEIFRLITYAFLHGSIIHLVVNMYSLFIAGRQVENNFGKVRLLIIYFISALSGGLLSALFSNGISIGASGAIFGLLGALVYFGLQFRLYLTDALVSKIFPIIIINLLIGFTITGIDNACHIGGLIGGFLAAMAVGVPEVDNKKDRINGIILLVIYTLFISYLLFFR